MVILKGPFTFKAGVPFKEQVREIVNEHYKGDVFKPSFGATGFESDRIPKNADMTDVGMKEHKVKEKMETKEKSVKVKAGIKTKKVKDVKA